VGVGLYTNRLEAKKLDFLRLDNFKNAVFSGLWLRPDYSGVKLVFFSCQTFFGVFTVQLYDDWKPEQY